MPDENLPRATAKRLPLYLRTFKMLKEGNRERISSADLSELIQVDSATIRRDFSYFGTLGRRGYGYDVDSMHEFFSGLLKQDTLINIVVVGIGNLGGALLKQNFNTDNNVRVTAGFDVSEEIVDTLYNGVPIYHMDEMVDRLEFMKVKIAILTVPTNEAQVSADKLVEAGVKGILNFTQTRVDVPDDVRVHTVDLSNELQTLIYFMRHYGNETLG